MVQSVVYYHFEINFALGIRLCNKKSSDAKFKWNKKCKY